MTIKPAVIIAAPSLGPAVITLWGQDIPVMAAVLSIAGLILARMVAPPPKLPMNRSRQWALTALLTIILLAAVITLQPSTGMAVSFGVGLGYSGMLAVEFFGNRIAAMLRVLTEGQ